MSDVPASAAHDDVLLVVGDKEIAGWQSVQITRSAELFPNTFVFSMTEQFTPSVLEPLVRPGMACQIYIGKDLILTGFVDTYAGRISGNAHEVQISGRGKCEDLMDCSADLLAPDSKIVGGSVPAQSMLDLAQLLCAPWKITVKAAADNPTFAVLPIFQVSIGETPYDIIERVARFTGFLLYEDEFGDLVIDRVGTKTMASGFMQGDNIEVANARFSVQERYTHLWIVFSTIDQTAEGYEQNVYNRRADQVDPALSEFGPRYRPRIVATVQSDNTPDYAQRMADWEMHRRYGRSQAVQITCDSWRDKDQKLWRPNWLVPVHVPALYVNQRKWIIGTVLFRKDLSGTHADLTLMPPDAFAVRPAPLTVWDYELTNSVPSPDPPRSNPAEPGPGGLLGHV